MLTLQVLCTPRLASEYLAQEAFGYLIDPPPDRHVMAISAS